MTNEILWILMLLINFLAIIISYRLFGKTGLFIWTPIAIILANIQVLKTVSLFGFTATLGNIVYATSFLVTDILSENYGKKDAQKAVSIGFFALLFMTLIMNLAIRFVPHESDFSQTALTTIFSIMPRVAFASITAYLISQFHDVWAYHFWKSLKPSTKFIWLRNNASTMVSQLIDSAVFTAIAFIGIFKIGVVWELFWTTYLLKLIVAALDTPFVYIAHFMKNKTWVE